MQGGGEVEATAEEQAQLEAAFEVALDMIHGQGQSGDKIAQMVLNNQDVTQGIGQAAATVLIGVEKKLGGLPDDMKLQLAAEIAGELAELAVNAGALAEDEVNDTFIEEMLKHAYSAYLQTKEAMGELNPQELESSVSEAEQIMGNSVRGGQPQQQPAQPQGRGLLNI